MKKLRKFLSFFVLLGLSCPLAGVAANDDDDPEIFRCTLDGKRIKPAKSGYYEFVNTRGSFVCVFLENGKTIVNEKLSAQPAESRFRFNSDQLEAFNKSNQFHGTIKFYDINNVVVLQEIEYRDGKQHGRQIRRNRSTNAIDTLAFYQNGELWVHLRYDVNGNVTVAACNARSVIPEDFLPCGFDGKPMRAMSDAINQSFIKMQKELPSLK
jgi:hypothetical protein